MPKIILAVSIMLLTVSPAAFAAQSEPEQDTVVEQDEAIATGEDREIVKQEADEADQKKICKRIKKMGSRFSEKVCMTKDQWEAERRGTQDNVRDRRR